MTEIEPTSRFNAFQLVAVVLAAMALVAGVFAVPYVIPASSPVVSASSLAGYNNSAAYLLYLVLVVMTGVLMAPFLKSIPIATPRVSQALRFAPTFLVWVVLGGHLVLFAVLYAVKGYFVFGDGVYFQQVLARMTAGSTPYRDVNFLYGPAMLYPAFWLSRHVGVTAAYGLYYVATYLTGLYLLYLCVQAVTDRIQDVNRFFLLLSLGLFNALIGLNYVFLRHLLPVASLFCAWRFLERPSGLRFALSVLLLFATVTYSPEMGVLAMGSIVVLAVIRTAKPSVRALFNRVTGVGSGGETHGLVGPPRWERDMADSQGPATVILQCTMICGLALLGLLAVFYAIDPTSQALIGFMRPILSYAAGGGNSPIYPSLPMLSLMTVSVVVVALTLKAAQRRDFWPEAEIVLALLALSVLIQRPAFGKPDVVHIAYSGLPIFLMALWFLSDRWGNLLRCKWVGWALLVGVLVPMQVFNGFMFKPVIERQLSAVGVAPEDPLPASGTKRAIQDSLRRVVLHFGPERTYYLHILSYYSLPLVMEFRLKQVPYISTLEEAFTDEDMVGVIHEIRASDAVVVSRRGDLQRSGRPPQETRASWLYQLTASPLPGSRSYSEVVRANERLREPLLVFLQASYEVVFEDGDLVGLIPRRTGSTLSPSSRGPS